MSIPLISAPASGTSSAHPLVRAVSAALAGLAREWRVQRAMHQIGGLDDRLLADIGIGHGQAERAVRHGRDAVPAPGTPIRHAAGLDLGAGWTEWR